jgi:SnoaL-like polyketide cyclase
MEILQLWRELVMVMATKSAVREQLAFRIIDNLFNVGDPSVIDETCSENISIHVPGIRDELRGIQALKDYYKDFLKSFTLIHLHVRDMHSEDNLVDAHTTMTATYIRPFLGTQPTQKEVTVEPVFFLKFGPDEKVIEYTQDLDIVELTR